MNLFVSCLGHGEPGLPLPPHPPFPSLGRCCQRSPWTVPVALPCVGSTRGRATALRRVDPGGGGGRGHERQQEDQISGIPVLEMPIGGNCVAGHMTPTRPLKPQTTCNTQNCCTRLTSAVAPHAHAPLSPMPRLRRKGRSICDG